MAPLLSICVPSRNRQASFRQTIRDLIANRREDVEFVLVDNSDDAAIMDEFAADLDDPRIRYLSSATSPLPMQDNWERAIKAAAGEWVVFIGDDDYVDPDVVDTIGEIVARRPDVDAIGWNRMSFKWPEYRPFHGGTSMSLANSVAPVKRERELRALFLWEGAAPVPKTAFSVYHGAVRRDVMTSIRDRFSGRYFEHPTVDFDCSSKLLLLANELVYIDRPFSVFGATSASNSSAVGRFARVAELHAELEAEGQPAVEDPEFPFTSRLGVAASILAAQHWFKSKYDLRFDGWEENFVKALAIDCGLARDRRNFDDHSARCREELARWRDGAWLDAFQPRFVSHRDSAIFTGLCGKYLYIDERIAGCETPAQLYAVAKAILPPASELEFRLERASGPSTAMGTAA